MAVLLAMMVGVVVSEVAEDDTFAVVEVVKLVDDAFPSPNSVKLTVKSGLVTIAPVSRYSDVSITRRSVC